MERLTISSGEITFYADTYNKCSNKNAKEVKSKVEQGIPYYDIKEYKYKQYNTDELSEMYSKLSKLEDIMEKYGIETIEELDILIKKQMDNMKPFIKGYIQAYKDNDFAKIKQDRDTWKKACELMGKELDMYATKEDNNCSTADYFYQQAKTEGNDET